MLYGSEEDYDQLVLHLILRLLQGCLPYHRKRINRDNYNTYLRHFLTAKQEEAEEENLQYRFENPFLDNLRQYSELDLKEKVLVLHHLCELRLDGPDISEKVKHLEGASLRVDPLGVDSYGTTYWYFYGTRLYQENVSVKEREEKKKRKKHKKRKKRKKSQDSQISSDEDQECCWSVACLTEEDWDQLALKYKYSDRREDRRLYRLLNDGFLPEIREMFGEKRKEEARKAKQQLSRRSSSRVEVLKKQQEENDRQLALKVNLNKISLELLFFVLFFWFVALFGGQAVCLIVPGGSTTLGGNLLTSFVLLSGANWGDGGCQNCFVNIK